MLGGHICYILDIVVINNILINVIFLAHYEKVDGSQQSKTVR